MNNNLTATDKLNIVCFAITMAVSAVCIVIAKKMKLPVWKLQIGLILFYDVIGVILLITRLSHA